MFGPEGGSIPGDVLEACHRFVVIPSATRTPLNLAAAVNIVLYDRYVRSLDGPWVPPVHRPRSGAVT